MSRNHATKPDYLPLYGHGKRGMWGGIKPTGDNDKTMQDCQQCGRSWSVEMIDAKCGEQYRNIGFYVRCIKCRLETKFSRTTQQAIEAWNNGYIFQR